VVAAVAAEIGLLLGVNYTGISRYDTGGAATVVGVWNRTGTAWPMAVGDRLTCVPRNSGVLEVSVG